MYYGVSQCLNVDGLADLIDGAPITAAEAVSRESEYSRLANEAHALRLENERLRDAIGTITCALEALPK